MNAEYNEGFLACAALREISDNPYRNDPDKKRDIAWRNGWKDCAYNEATRGFDTTHEWIETGAGPRRGYRP